MIAVTLTRAFARPANLVTAALLALNGAAPARDLEVALPPGPATEWSASFPALSPGPGGLFARSPAETTRDDDRNRSSTRPERIDFDVRMSGSFGLVRILTWDLAAHIEWVRGRWVSGPRSVVRGGAAEPSPGDGLYWVSLVPLLRLMLHRSSVSEAETMVHLLEIGDPVLPVLGSAESEPSLKAVARRLRSTILGVRVVHPAWTTGALTRGEMFERLAYDELQRQHPHDPDGDFGRRLFLFGEEVRPAIASHLHAKDSLVRRNAVAALGRYRDPRVLEPLVGVALRSSDPVARIRALVALGRVRTSRFAQELVQRLAEVEDEVERIALVDTLGRMGARESVPALIALGREAKSEDPDTLMSVLAALARITPRDQAGLVREFVASVESSVRSNPRGYRPERRGSGMLPDIPDSPDTRARILMELALCVRARLGPDDEAEAKLVELTRPSDSTRNSYRIPDAYSNRSLLRIEPYVRFLFLEALRTCGAAGQELLARIVDDPSVEPVLRAHALVQLPLVLREKRTLELLVAEETSSELALYAFEVALLDGTAAWESFARKSLVELAERRDGGGDAARRQLYLSVVRALDLRRKLRAADLLPLAEFARAPRLEVQAKRNEVRDAVGALVVETVAGAGKPRREELVNEILDLVETHGLNLTLDDSTRDAMRSRILGMISQLATQRGNPNYHATVIDAVLVYLLGTDVSLLETSVAPDFAPAILLEEEILLALGRTGTKEAVAALESQSADAGPERKALLMLALGLSGQKSTARTLTRGLLDADPYVRLCAYESLRHVTQQDHFADWLYGTSRERQVAAEAYHRWTLENL